MIIRQDSRAIAVFSDFEAAAHALDRLVLTGFSLTKLFVVGENFTACEQNGRIVKMEHRAEKVYFGEITGTALGLTKGFVMGNGIGGVVGFCLGLGMLALPGVGQIAFTSAIIFTLISSGICTAAGGLIGALIGLGITEQQANTYSDLVARGNYLIVMTGYEQELKRAEQMLSTQKIRK